MLFGERVDWIRVLEASYEAPTDDVSWADGVLDALGGARRPGIGMQVFSHSADCRRGEARIITGGPEVAKVESAGFSALIERFGPKAVRGLYYPRRTVATMLEMAGDIPRDAREWVAEHRSEYGVVDALGVFFHPVPGVAGVLYSGSAEPIRVGRHERDILARVALHLETAYRLRADPANVLAVIRPDGRVVHREEAVAADIPSVSDQVQHIERARSRAFRQSPQALEVWTALVGGRLSLVERRDGARRSYLVVENAPRARALRALTRRELDAVSHAARGMSAKLVAYGLGLSPARVSSLLSAAASKVGLATRLELVRMAALLTRDPRGGFDEMSLTAAERDVLELLQQGLTNAEIARLRHRSVRTIANQVATLLRKTGAATRRALVARRSS